MRSRSLAPPHAGCLVGAVLAGGASTRMDAPKPAMELRGRPLIAYPLKAIAGAGLEPVVVAKPDSELPSLGCRVLRDTRASFHPAAGILAALDLLDEPVVTVACDMPFVPAGLVGYLAGLDAPVAVPRIGGRLQPLLARYEQSAASALTRAIELSAPLHETITSLDPLIVDEPDLTRFGDPLRITFNVNDRDHLATAERLMAPAPSQ